VEDVQQEVILVLRPALARCGPPPGGRPDPFRPCALLRKVLLDAFCNCARSIWRADRRFDRSAKAADLLDAAVGPSPAAPAVPAASRGKAGDPARLLEGDELRALLAEELSRLSASVPWLAEHFTSGVPLRRLAARWGIPLDRAKRLRRRYLARLAHRLRDFVT
jgi:hypothetical protein